MNIPGLDAPSWSRISGNDEQQEEEEEFKAEQIWNQQQQQQAQADKAVQFIASGDASASSAVVSCDLLVVACGMMSSAFLSTMMDGTEGNAAAAGGALQELGRFTLTADDAATTAAATVAAPSSKSAKAAAARPHALILAHQPGSSTLYAFNYLRMSAPQYYSVTAALFERVAPKQVLLLDSLNQGQYISTTRPAPCPPLLRRLQSTAFVAAAAPAAAAVAAAAATPVPELEAPNLANTWSASVLTQCEVSRIPAQLFISLESRHYVVETLQAFEALFPSLLATGLPASSAPQLRAAAAAFLGADEKRRVSAYKSVSSRLERVYGYTAGQDSSMRETAAEVQRSSGLDAMFF